MAAALIAHGLADVIGQLVQMRQDVLDRATEPLGMLLDRGVHLVDVGLVMLVMMQPHGLRIDGGLQRVVGELQRRKDIGAKGGLVGRHGLSSSGGQEVGDGGVDGYTDQDRLFCGERGVEG